MRPSSTAERRTRYLGLAVVACLAVLYLWPIDRNPGVNVYAHVDQAASIVIDGTLSIDRFILVDRPNTIDWSRAPDGHYYPAKAPGAALYAVPAYLALYHVERWAGIDPLGGWWFRRNAVLINWTMNAALAACAIAMLAGIGERLGLARGTAVAGAIAVAIGTPYYPYATAYYAHVPAAVSIAASSFFVFARRPRQATDAAAGLLAGVAVLFDYPAVIAVICLGLVLAAMRPRALTAFAAGGLVPALVLFTYHTVAFGSPVATPYAYQNPYFASEEGFFLNPPTLRVLRELTVGQYRGLFFYSPVFVLGLYGAWTALRANGAAPEEQGVPALRIYAAAALGIFTAWVLLNASYRVWWGGYTAGPRFMIPAIVLFAPLIGIGLQRFIVPGLVLLAISAANQFAIASVWVRLPEDYSRPLTQVIYPSLLQGEFDRSNIGISLGVPPFWSLVPPALAAVALLVICWRVLRGSSAGGAVPRERSEAPATAGASTSIRSGS